VSEVPPASRSEEIFAAGARSAPVWEKSTGEDTARRERHVAPEPLLGTRHDAPLSVLHVDGMGPQLTFFCNDAVPEVAKAMATKPGQTSLR